MVFVKGPSSQLFELGYSLGLAHEELESRQLRRPRVRIAEALGNCAAASNTMREQATTPTEVAAAEAMGMEIDRLRRSVRDGLKGQRRKRAAEQIRLFLAGARSHAAALCPEHGRQWLALGGAVGRWEMASKSKPDTVFLRRMWRSVRHQVGQLSRWLAGTLLVAGKKRRRIGSLADSFRGLFWDHWEYDRLGKNYVRGQKVSDAEYKVLVTLRILDGAGATAENLRLYTDVQGVHNTLGHLRRPHAFPDLISRTGKARWTDPHFPMPPSSAIPRDLHEYVLANV